MYTLALRQSARKELDRLDESMRRRIGLAFESLKIDPFQGKTLRGDLYGLRSIRVWPYRIVYEIRKYELIVLVVEIAHRKDAYR